MVAVLWRAMANTAQSQGRVPQRAGLNGYKLGFIKLGFKVTELDAETQATQESARPAWATEGFRASLDKPERPSQNVKVEGLGVTQWYSSCLVPE